MSPKCRHAGVCLLIVAMSVPALGAEFLWVPIEASGSHTINGNEIVLDGAGHCSS